MENRGNSPARGFIALLGSMVLASTMSPAFKTALAAGVTPMGAALWRMVFTLVMVLGVCRANAGAWRDLRLLLREKKLLYTVAAMGVTRGVEIICWSLALSVSGTFVVSILGNTTPVFTIVLLYLFYRERTPLAGVLGVGVSLGGMVLIGLSSGSVGGAPLWSILVMPFSSCAYAVFLLLGRDVIRRISVWPMMFVVFLISGIMVLIYGGVAGMDLSLPPAALPCILFIALFCTLLSHTITTWCTRVLRPVTISMAQLFSPVVSALTAFVLLGERVSAAIFLGGGVVLLGLLLYALSMEYRRAAGAPPAKAPAPQGEAERREPPG